MAVYTTITEDSLRQFLDHYDIGMLVSFHGIAKGVSNTNYFVKTTTGPYILTIFEEHRVRTEDLPFYFAYAAHLAGKGIACPHAIESKDGNHINRIEGKAAAIINFLQGEDLARGSTGVDACMQMGEFLARMHDAAKDFMLRKKNDWAPARWRPLADRMRPKMDGYYEGLETVIYEELDFIEDAWPQNLPSGAIHADVFPDNVFFLNGTMTAVIDFYFACTEYFLFDLSIVINAWCFDAGHQFQQDRYEALMRGYESVRPLTMAEKESLNVMCRATALRYLLSRLDEYLAHRKETLMQPHDPMEYLIKLQFHKEHDVRKF